MLSLCPMPLPKDPSTMDPPAEHDRLLASLANALLAPEFVVHYAAGFIAQAQEEGGAPPVRSPGSPEVAAPGADRPWSLPW
jgi:hypothetical protein